MKLNVLHRAGRIRAAVIFLCLATLALALAAGPLATASDRQPIYLLRDDGGHLAAFTPDGSEKLSSYNEVLTRLLPPDDCEALLAGIPVYTEQELARLVEDFGG